MYDKDVRLAYKYCMDIAAKPNSRNRTGLFCDTCYGDITVAYHEEQFYSVCCRSCGKVMLVKARSMSEAIEKAGYMV